MMPLFGEKRFRRAERGEITARLSEPLSSSAFGTSNDKDSIIDYPSVLALANEIFGFNGWSHSVMHQTIDFIMTVGDTYEVGVSALVKVMLKDGTFHEDVGYGVSKGLKCKGSSLSKARRDAACDGLRNALSAFGKGLSVAAPTKKITDFLQPSQAVQKKSNATLSSVKRKLIPEFDNSPGSSSSRLRVIASTSSQNAARNSSPINAHSVLLPPFLAQSSPTIYQIKHVAKNQDTPSTTTDDSILASPLAHNGDSLPSSPNIVQKILSQPGPSSALEKDRISRKLRQIDLEIRARESVRKDLLIRLESPEKAQGPECDKHNFVMEPEF